MKIFYIAEFILPSNRAYSIHVFKMLDSFAKKGMQTQLIIPYANSKINYLTNRVKNHRFIRHPKSNF